MALPPLSITRHRPFSTLSDEEVLMRYLLISAMVEEIPFQNRQAPSGTETDRAQPGDKKTTYAS
jgi:hypothetical protein